MKTAAAIWKAVLGTMGLVTVLGGLAADAHPGRTNASGCHTCRTNCRQWGLKTGEYHCHGGSVSRTPQPSSPTRSRSADSLRREPSNSGEVPSRSLRDTIRVLVQDPRVVDGDTLLASIGGRQRHLHLCDVDAPEIEQPYGPQAKQLLSTYLIIGQPEVVIVDDRAEGGLWVRVVVGDEDLTHRLLDAGLAWASPGANDALRRRQDIAKGARLGLWSQRQPQEPWNWRLHHGKGGS